MKRLFIALPIPETITKILLGRISLLVRTLPDVRMVPMHNWHITLRFLGNCTHEDARVLEHIICETAQRHTAPELSIRSIRYGPPGPIARMIWAVGTSQPFIPIRESIDGMIDEFKLRPDAAARPLKLHVTLARFSRILPVATLPPIQEKVVAQDSIDRIMLMESLLLPKGAHYTCLRSAHFRNGDQT